MDCIKETALSVGLLKQGPNGIPIIFCTLPTRVVRKLEQAGYVTVSLNKELAAALREYPVKDRPDNVMKHFQQIMVGYANPILLTDFEMLFDPAYKLDTVKLLCDTARYKKIAVKWCGECRAGALIYSAHDYIDYYEYAIDDKIICVK